MPTGHQQGSASALCLIQASEHVTTAAPACVHDCFINSCKGKGVYFKKISIFLFVLCLSHMTAAKCYSIVSEYCDFHLCHLLFCPIRPLSRVLI